MPSFSNRNSKASSYIICILESKVGLGLKFVILFCLLTYFFSAVYRIYHFPYFHAWMTFHVWKLFFSLFWCFPSEAKIFIKLQFEDILTVAEVNGILIGFWLRNVEILLCWCWRSFLSVQHHWSKFYRWHQNYSSISIRSLQNWSRKSIWI